MSTGSEQRSIGRRRPAAAALATALLALLAATDGAGDDDVATTPELGRVAWGRDFDAATAEARRDSKPLAILFQEVPG